MESTEPTEAGRAALVTGAAQGIGLGIARALAAAGCRVALGDVLAEQVAGAAAGLASEFGVEMLGLALDVTRADDWAEGVARVDRDWGRLDVLVNCAGVSPRGTVESTHEALWDRTLEINLKGAWLGIKSALPMLQLSRGAIINIGSTRSTRPMPGLFSYVVSKSGLWGLTRQVAVEYLKAGIRCNMVAPGWVDTPGERALQARHGLPDFPAGLRNIVTPEEVGAAVVYLASPLARRINGITLYLDAGLHIADDAGMVFQPERVPPPFQQRID
jgi:3-oxoacyl-[acyl-carrier protein] reductase